MERQATSYPILDYLRLFLAAEVVYFHLSMRATDYSTPFLPFAPVPGFVAISGFLILGSLRGSRTMGDFWSKRAFRILPAFLISFLIVWLLFGTQAVPKAVMTWATVGWVKSRNFPLWSLSAEEILYVALAFLATVGAFRPRLGVWALWLATMVFHTWALKQPWERTLPAPLLHLVPSFATGLLCYFEPWILERARRVIIPLFVGVLVAQYFCEGKYHFWGNLVSPSLSAVTLLAIGTLPTKLPRLRTDLSYPLYIYHVPILHAVADAGYKGIALMGFTLAPALAVSYISARFIERPLVEWNRKRLKRKEESDKEKGPPPPPMRRRGESGLRLVARDGVPTRAAVSLKADSSFASGAVQCHRRDVSVRVKDIVTS